jgi:hypothetical protein
MFDSLTRRRWLQHSGLGFGGLALASMLARDGVASELAPMSPGTGPHRPPRIKNVIWLFMVGGASHLESFDPKPALNEHAGKTIDESPYAAILKSPYLANERVVAPDANGLVRNTIYPMQIGWRKQGDSGLEISDWWPHLATCADDLCLVRSMWIEDSNHGAQLQFHSGKHRLDGFHPTIGSWAAYGLGSLNQNLPEFVVLGTPLADCCGGQEGHRASYLGPQYDGVRLNVDPQNPLPYATRPGTLSAESQLRQFDLLRGLNRLTAEAYPDDPAVAARVQSYELAFRMQTAVPDVVRYGDETQSTQTAYGLDQAVTKPFGEQLLVARRLVERGVRFVQVFHGSNGGAGGWDAHGGLKANHELNCKQVDQPIAALLKDLKARGLLEETLVVWATEFGRTPGSQGTDGRDHHPYGFSIWLAGGGIRGGLAHGKTDELGFHAVEDRHYVTDLHATVLHQLGLDHRRLFLPDRVRLERDFGHVITPILA